VFQTLTRSRVQREVPHRSDNSARCCRHRPQARETNRSRLVSRSGVLARARNDWECRSTPVGWKGHSAPCTSEPQNLRQMCWRGA